MKPNGKDSVEEHISQLLDELMIVGFAVVKEIATLRKQQSGVMLCPMCGRELRFSIAKSNGHLAAHCKRQGCINIVE
jgi:hypothetical protein